MRAHAFAVTNGAGFLANGLWDLFAIAVPLYAVSLGCSASQIGLLVAARAVLPAVFALHGGMLMDSYGVRRVLVPLAALNIALSLLYPLTPWFGALLVLQLLTGLTSGLAWSGAQTLINQLSAGEVAIIGRFGFHARLGSMLAPLVAGAVWDMTGAWGTFSVICAWSALLLAVVCMLPVVAMPATHAPRPHATAAARSRLPEILSWRRLGQALALLSVPTVAFICALSFLRSTPAVMQGSFYVVLLQEAGLLGTTIGMLIALAEISAGVGSLYAAKLVRGMPLPLASVIGVAAAIFFIAITPLIMGLFMALVGAAVLRGLAQGANQPLLGAMVARDPGLPQGTVFGLRMGTHRLSAILLPALMGWAIEAWGISAGFYVIGACTMVLCCAALVVLRR